MIDTRQPPDNVEGIDADLQRLQVEAQAVDAGINPVLPKQQAAQEQQAAQVQASEVEELASMLFIVAMMAIPMFPSLATIYTQEKCHELSAAIVPVLVKRGWSVGGFMQGWAEEVALLIVAVPLGWATYKAIQADIAAAKAKEKAEKAKNPEPVAVEFTQGETEGQQDNEPVFAARG